MLRALGVVVLAMLATAGLVAAGHGLGKAHASGNEPLLPNLVADPPTMPASNEEGGPLVTDSSTGTPRLLLRFNGYVRNTGPGAVDFRGSREKPKVSKRAEEEAAHLAEPPHPPLGEQAEKEYANPPMHVFQRLYLPSSEETNLERPHEERESKAELKYANADGHNHWHLQHVARYSLWNAARTGEVAPAQKVGFCLEDSEHVEKSKGPSTEVYGDEIPGEPNRAFCKQYQPGMYESGSKGLFEGISPGWRDLYRFSLAWQWVDVSETVPGEYWLREEVNPLGVIKELGTGEKSKFATTETIIPGFVAKAQSVEAAGTAKVITLESQVYSDSETPAYAIVTGPEHGSLEFINDDQVLYTPTGTYSGPDSFTFSAADPTSPFPRSPKSATVAIQDEAPSLAISGVQEQMVAGTSLSLSALVGHDSGGVEWEATSGSMTPGAEGTTAVYHAPTEAGTVTLTARLRDDREVIAHAIVKVIAAPAQTPAPEVPAGESKTPSPVGSGAPGSGQAGYTVQTKPGVTRPRAMWMGRNLVLSTIPSSAGKVRLTVYRGKHAIGTCAAVSPAGRRFTCRLTPGASISRSTHLSVLASLRIGKQLFFSLLPSARIPTMQMVPSGKKARTASAGSVYWCSPSTLVPTLE